MRRFFVALGFGVGLTIAGSAFATPPSSPPSPIPVPAAGSAEAAASDPAKPKAANEELVCETSNDTGSHVRRTRVCMTRAEQADRQAQGRKDMQQLYDQSRQIQGPPPGIK